MTPPGTTLIVMEDAPYPPRRGSQLRNWQHVNVLAKRGPVHVFSVGICEADAALPLAASWTHVDSREFPHDGAGLRGQLRRAVRPRQFPIDSDRVTRALNERLRAVIRAVRPDLYVLSHWHDALPSALRDCRPLIVDAHNVESKLYDDVHGASGGTLRERYRLWQFKRRERALFRAADRIWLVSADDAAAVRRLDERLRTPYIWPNAIDLTAYEPIRRARSERRTRTPADPTVMYAGSFSFKPNAAAAITLIAEIFPLVARRLPSARLLFVGKDPTPDMRSAAARDPRIVVTGAVPEMAPFLESADVLAVPLRAGGGTRLKILEAFAAGVPVVATAKGAEGLGATDGVHLRIRDDAPAFADALLDVVADPAGAHRRADAARTLVAERFSWETLIERSADAISVR